MATYVYETIPRRNGETPRQFEIVQSMKDAPLQQHPETGEPVRRVITGGYGIMATAGPAPKATAGTGGVPCRPGCGCHRPPSIPTP